MRTYPRSEKRFIRINQITIFSLFVLIMAGGVVRSTGSGMGCPDWPRCFGRLVPPTDSLQLPAGYEAQYVAGRAKKNSRFAKTLDALGFKNLADKIRNDQSILTHEEFNAAKTWTEYINRLIGAVTGLLLLLCVFFSRTFFKNRKRIFYLSLVNVIAVGFQAWLGSIVVSTNLTTWVITIHMLLALLIVAISIYTYFQARALRDHTLLSNRSHGWLKGLLALGVMLTLVQVGLGTEVREVIDEIADSGVARADWINKLGDGIQVHRDLAVLVLGINLIAYFAVRFYFTKTSHQSYYSNVMMVILVLQLLVGGVLAYLGTPAYAQTLHLVLASLFFGTQFYLMLLLGRNIR
ncbi:cytochrome c oxidase assembly protein subunit 15 [bacterium A37T11]|nr:cytochrome c oxidase assembly protein subunit 15 [bacterium A37T11]